MPLGKCKDCTFWKVIELPDTVIEHPGYWTEDVPPVWVEPWTETIVNTGSIGNCRAHPPVITGNGEQPWRQPETERDTKCGEFEAEE